MEKKPFNLKAALRGEPVENGEGSKVVQLFLFDNPKISTDYPLHVYFENSAFRRFTITGHYNLIGIDASVDLFMSEIQEQPNTFNNDFDLTKALAGHPVVDGFGKKVIDIKYFENSDKAGFDYPVIVYFDNGRLDSFTKEGFISKKGTSARNDKLPNYNLKMAPIQKEGWINIYKNDFSDTHKPGSNVYESESVARERVGANEHHLDTIKIKYKA